MALEIEKKFLVVDDSWRSDTKQIRMTQGYIPSGEGLAVRVRIENDIAKLAVKGKKSDLVRLEYEYEIPMSDAEEIMENLCSKPVISKVRHLKEFAGKTWEIDVFEGENEGLIVAEIELDDENEVFEIPSWAGEEVTTQKEYRNNYLAEHPYNTWKK